MSGSCAVSPKSWPAKVAQGRSRMPINLVPQLVSAAIRAFGLGVIALFGLWLFRVRSSTVRHAAWTVVLVGMLLQIPLGLVAPTVPLKALPALPAPVQPGVTESVRITLP